MTWKDNVLLWFNTLSFRSVLASTFLILLLSVLVSFTRDFRKSQRSIWPAGSPPRILSRDYSFYGSTEFWKDRNDFFNRERAKRATKAFGFRVGKHPVVGLTGPAGRMALFSNPKLDLGEGQTFLLGGTPLPESEDNIMKGATFLGWFVTKLRILLKSDYLTTRLPTLRTDIIRHLSQVTTHECRVVNPFDYFYTIVFQLTMRTVGVEEIARDWAYTVQVAKWYRTYAENFGPLDPIAPWLPTFAKGRRTYSATRLYLELKKVIQKRISKGTREDDAVQRLIDEDVELEWIVTFVIAGLGGGQSNTGYNTAFLIYVLGVKREWQEKVMVEIKRVAGRFAPDGHLSLSDQLAYVPITAWEGEFPILLCCLNESIRHTLMGSAIRKNISSKPLRLENDVLVPAKGFTVCQYADAHYDPSIYINPEAWDPSRFESHRAEHKKQAAAFMGWGYGRHPCAGERFARIEVSYIVAHFLARFEPEPCDAIGNVLENVEVPAMQLNAYATTTPKAKVFLKIKDRSDKITLG